jgi:4-hydroxy-2-oxoheptanedioate aldolase
LRSNLLKQKLAEGKIVYGAMIQSPDPDLAEMLGLAGFDWILVDAEHGSLNENDAAAMARACELAGTTAVIRPPRNDPEDIMRFMDRGIHGVQVPRVNTAAQARAAVEAVKYHPLGLRGITSTARSASFGFREPIPEYIKRSNEETFVCVMIEELEAIDNLDEIMAVEGVDAFFVGGGDLAQTMGYPGQKGHPAVQEVVRGAIRRIVAAGKVAGYACESETKEFAALGVRYFHTGSTQIVKLGARQYWSMAGEQRI